MRAAFRRGKKAVLVAVGAQPGRAKNCRDKIGTPKTGTLKINRTKIDMAKIDMAKISTPTVSW